MKLFKYLTVLLVVFSLYGCVVITPNIGVKKEFWDNKTDVVGVAVVKLPEAQAHKAGSQGLLDIAINNANAGDLEEALKKQDLSSIHNVQDKVVAYLSSKGFKVKKVAGPIDLESLKELEATNDDSKAIYYARRDFKPLKSSLGVDKLVMIQVNAVGTIRSYYGFFPIGAPSGYSVLNGYVVNLADNRLEWNQSVTQTVPHGAADWDVPPDFVALVKAMDSAYKQSQSMLLNNFVQ